MDDLADFHDVRLEDAVCGRIGNHQCGQVIAVLFGLATQVFHIHVAPVVAGTSDRRESGLYGTGRIGSVGTGRDEHLVAVSLANAFQISPDGTQTGIFACRTRVGLEADTGKTGDDL